MNITNPQFAVNLPAIALIALLLLLFGFLYNHLLEWRGRQVDLAGRMWQFVVGGVSVVMTSFAVALQVAFRPGLPVAEIVLVLLVLFGAAGAGMIRGDINRRKEAEADTRNHLRRENDRLKRQLRELRGRNGG